MKAKEKLYYLITNYLKGKYSTRAFCNEYTQVYNIDLDKKNLQECEFASVSYTHLTLPTIA